MITQLSELNPNAHYTYADYLLWKFKERVELIKGTIREMAAPNVRHQRISALLSRKLGNLLDNHSCDVFSAPFDVRLPLPPHRITTDKVDTVVQPDICVVCDQSKLDERGCIGAPEIAIEILPPGNAKREMKEKYNLYEAAGVQEYWVIDPVHDIVFTYILNPDNQQFVPGRPLTDEDTLQSTIFEGFSLSLEEVFK